MSISVFFNSRGNTTDLLELKRNNILCLHKINLKIYSLYHVSGSTKHGNEPLLSKPEFSFQISDYHLLNTDYIPRNYFV